MQERKCSVGDAELSLYECSELSDVAALGQGIGALQSLQHLQLSFDGCRKLSHTLQNQFTEQGAFLAAFGR